MAPEWSQKMYQLMEYTVYFNIIQLLIVIGHDGLLKTRDLIYHLLFEKEILTFNWVIVERLFMVKLFGCRLPTLFIFFLQA